MIPPSATIRSIVLAMVAWCAFAALCAAAAPAIPASSPSAWTLPDAPYRAVFRLKDAPANPEAGILLTLPEFGQTRPGLGDLVLTDAAGTVQPLAPVYSHSGDQALALALSMRAGEDYFLYCGGTRSRVTPGWTPRTSLFEETRLIPDGLHCDSWADMDTLWRRTQTLSGGDFVPHIFHGSNPFGRSSDYLTHYSGYLNPPEGNSVFLYTASADASFVLVNDRFEFGWPGKHSGYDLPSDLHGKTIPTNKAPLKIDYYLIKGADGYLPAGVLGWTVGGVPQTIPPEAWLHPGTSQLVTLEGVNGLPVPRILTSVKSYLGYAGEWYHHTDYSLASALPAGWTAVWQFADGVATQGARGSRILTGADPQIIAVKLLARGASAVQGIHSLHFPDDADEVDVNQPGAIRPFVDLAASENPDTMNAASARARVILCLDFGTDEQAARFAPALSAADRAFTDPLTLRAAIAAIQTRAETDPPRAMEALRALPSNLREKDDALALLETDLLVFYLHDPNVEARAIQLSFGKGDTDAGKRMLVRAGDAARLQGRYDDAFARYQKAVPLRMEPTKAAALDQAYGLTISNLLDQNQRDEAAAKLAEWEIRHPQSKLSTDFLLWRARIAMLHGRWLLARTELDSFAKMMPESPYQIDTQFYLAQALAGSGKSAEARTIWEKIAKDFPNNPLAAKSRELASGKQP